MKDPQINHLLAQSWPFFTLSNQERTLLLEQSTSLEMYKGDVLYKRNESLQNCFFLIDGVIEIYKFIDKERRYQESLERGAFLGEHSLLLETPTEEELIAKNNCHVLKISEQTLTHLIQSNQRFRFAVARRLRHKRSLIEPLIQFSTKLSQYANEGMIHFEKLLKEYQKMTPALHSLMKDERIDFNAWSYAKARLPENILTNHIYLLSPMPPPLLNTLNMEQISTPARRRSIWNLGYGKSLVLIRDRHTDLTDFVTNLCVHSIEARKIRRRINASLIVQQLNQVEESPSLKKNLENELSKLLKEDWAAFKRLWDNPFQALLQILLHHEDYGLYIQSQKDRYSQDSSESWIGEIHSAIKTLFPTTKLEDLQVDIISSNTFGVRYCLSPYLHSHKEDILNWGKETNHAAMSAQYKNPNDLLYALLEAYFEAHPHFEAELKDVDQIFGIKTISPNGFTGIAVDLIDLSRLKDSQIDLSLPQPQNTQNHLILNIDYAFGKQAEDILGCLILLLGPQIQSINIMGKAGAVVGQRGDIMVASCVLMEPEEEIHRLNNSNICHESLKASGREIHEGLVLTVQGTLLQNHELLRYYRKLWQCVGLEMEGSFYARQIDRGIAAGLLSKDIASRFAYFVSDLPLQEGEQLSKDMNPWEFIPPLYAITRSFLTPILKE
ncbi:MAG: hypothetical protein CMK59_10905 [Proteobacteria bacterium]|nr:hypothetical protein [Pseudomonadota bacterium]